MRALAAALACLAILAVHGCGGDDEPAPSEAPASSAGSYPEDDPARSPACRAVAQRAVERAVVEAGGRRQPLERGSNDSLDLSMCEYREISGPELYVSITIDTAPKAPLRYYNLIAEARQRATFEAIPDSTRPVGVRGVGNEHAHGGVGAYWTRYRSQLTAIDDRTLVKIGFNVPGASQDASREAAAELARAVYAGAIVRTLRAWPIATASLSSRARRAASARRRCGRSPPSRTRHRLGRAAGSSASKSSPGRSAGERSGSTWRTRTRSPRSRRSSPKST